MSGRSYRLTARDNSGVFLGLSAGEILLIGTGFTATIVLRLAALPVLVSAVPLLVAAAAAKVRIDGRAVWQWLPLLASWSTSSLRGRHRWRTSLPLLPTPGGRPVDPPPVLRGIDITEIPDGARPFGAVRDRRAARLTAVVSVRAGRFTSADRSVQDALLAAWGDLLAVHATANSPVVQLGWSDQASPSTLSAHRAWLDTLPGDSAGSTEGRERYDAVVESVAPLAVEHETVLWITVSGREIAGRGKLMDRATAVLPSAMDTLTGCLHDAGLQAGAPLSTPELWRLLRSRCDPAPPDGIDGAVALAERMGLIAADNGGPVAMDTAWSEVHIDGAWHRTYWIEAWPRRPVPADWLSGFLAGIESAVVTVIYRPLDPARSHRRIDSQLVKLQAHRARKQDRGRRVTEVDERTELAVHDLEADLASGHAETLYLGLVCVTAQTLDELDVRCRAVEQTARGAQMALRVIHGRQDVAWAATLPFGLTDPGLVDLAGP